MTKKLSAVLLAFVMLFSITSAVPITAQAASLPKTSITSITAYPCGFTVYVGKQKNITGYQIQYATRSDFKNAAAVRTTNTSCAVRNRASAKKYYVRVRTYKKSGNRYTYSAWSGKRTITTLNKNASDPAHIKSIKAGHASFTVTTYASKNAKKFQARYSTNKNMSGAKTTTSNSTTIKVTGRAENKTYYVQTRTYKAVNGKNYYSNWSPTKSVKTQSHSYKAVYKTEPVYEDIPIYKDEPVYEEQPVYEDIPVYETKQKMVEEQCAYCSGCHVDCILEAQRLGYANYEEFHMSHIMGWDGLSCPCTYGNPDSTLLGQAIGQPNRKMYPVYEKKTYWYCSKEYFDEQQTDSSDIYIDNTNAFNESKFTESLPKNAYIIQNSLTKTDDYICISVNEPVYETIQTGTEHKQTDTKTVQTGTKKVQTGTERKQTGTKKILQYYKCSCGKTKK